MNLRLKHRMVFHSVTTLVAFVGLGLAFVVLLISAQLQNYRTVTLQSLTVLQSKYAHQHFLKVSYHLESLLDALPIRCVHGLGGMSPSVVRCTGSIPR